MILPELYSPILNEHCLKQAITIPECTIIERYTRIGFLNDLSVKVDVVQDGNLKFLLMK